MNFLSKTRIRALLLLMLCITCSLQSFAQDHDTIYVPPIDTNTSHEFCRGHEMIPIETPAGEAPQGLLPNPIPPGSSIICGKFRAVFMDIVNNTDYGFDDPNTALALQRKNCVCEVLTYLSSVLVIPANVGTTSPPIDILFNNSINNSGSYLGAATPIFPNNFQSIPGYYGGSVYTYITTGIKPSVLMEDGQITMNFGHPYEYCVSSFANNCSYDFKSVVLHEMTHLLGMFSLVSANVTTGNLIPLAGNFVFSRFDQQFLFWENGTGLTKVVSNTYTTNFGLNPTINVNTWTTAPNSSMYKIWLNNTTLSPTGSRLNLPLYSRSGFTQGTSFSHFEDYMQIQNWRSPGYVPNYVMSASLRQHQFKNRYSIPELRMLTALGYSIQTGYVDFPKIINVPPYTNGYVMSNNSYGPGSYMNSTPAAGNINLTITTNTCSPVTLNLASSTITNGTATQSLNLADPNDPVSSLTIFDTDPLTPGNQGVQNIRGCGNGGNNNNQLLVLGNNQIIFTPRPNFIGRAQYGFHLFDGDERGSYVVITIDVSAGNCFVNTPINEVVVNGTHEEGIRIRTTTDPFVNLVEEVDYSQAYVENAGPDATQYVGSGWSDQCINNSSEQCLFIHNGFCFGSCTGGGLPFTPPGFVNNRMMHAVMNTSFNETYNIHTAPVTNCFTYRLEADIFIDASYTPFVGSPMLNFVLHNMGIQVNPLAPTYIGSNHIESFPLNSLTLNTWQHISIPVTYSSVNPSNFLYMDATNVSGSIVLYYDNVSIKKVGSTGPLTVTAAPSANICGPGSVTLNASGGTSYTWSPATGLSSTTGASVVASPTVTTTYMVTAMGAGTCNTSFITVNVNTPPAVSISATGVGTCSPQLTASPSGNPCFTYLWQGPGSFTATTQVINPVVGGVYTLTVTNTCENNCSATTTYNLSMPTVTITANGACLPTTLTATPMPGFTYTWTGTASGTGNPFPITQAGTYTVTAYNSTTGCTMIGTINFTPANACCASAYINMPGSVLATGAIPPGGNIIAPTATALLAYYGSVLTITTNNYIIIDGNFTINHSIEFVNCPNIVFSSSASSMAKITVNPTFSLKIQNSTLRSICNYMWEGIESANASSNVQISNSSIRDMLKGVVLKNNAPITCTNNNFFENYTGMYFENMDNSYNPVITDNTYQTSTSLIPPYAGQKGKYGISLFNVGKIKIGNMVSASGGNIFKKLWTGIYIRVNQPLFSKGQIEIYNNQFETITGGQVGLPGTNGPISLYDDPDGTGIFGVNQNTIPLIGYAVLVNYHASCVNKFQSTTKAIVLTAMSATVNNTKQQGGIWGFMFNKTESRAYGVYLCNQSNVYKGIELIGNGGSGTMANNTILTSASYPASFNSVGLGLPTAINASFFSNTSPASFTFRENNITVPAFGGKGINLENTGSAVIAFKNNINLTTNMTSGSGDPQLHAISMTNCNGTKAQANVITGTAATQSANRLSVAGIFESATINTILECNKVKQTRFGFLTQGNCATGIFNIRGNTCENHYYGMYFRQLGQLGTFGDIGGVFGSVNKNNNNVWFGTYTGGFRVFRTGVFTTIPMPYIRTTSSTLLQTQSSGSPTSIKYLVSTNSALPAVSTFTCPVTPVILGMSNIAVVNNWPIAEAIARSKDLYTDYDNVANWIDAKELYFSLRKDTIATDTSTVLDSFYTALSGSVIEEILLANDVIDTLSDTTSIDDSTTYKRLLGNALTRNSMISGTNQYEINEKDMNDAYLKYVMYGMDIFTEEEKEAIAELANSCPLEGGTAVYKARMLYRAFFPSADFDDAVLCPGSGSKPAGQENITNEGPISIFSGKDATQFSIYPNPATSRVIVKYDKPGMLELTDVVGRVIQKVELPAGSTIHTLELKNFIPGVYTYRYLVNDTAIDVGKLVIVQ